MTAESRGALASAKNDLFEQRAQRATRERALFLMPALAAVASARVSLGVKAGEGLETGALLEELVAHGLRQTTRPVVLFDDDEASLFSHALQEVARNLLEGEPSHAPDLEVVEEGLVA